MTDHEIKIGKWQVKAAELHTTAKGMKRGRQRDTMTEVAVAYRRMAQKAIKEGAAKRRANDGGTVATSI
jgi:hypothetical protein